jgi:predicted dehydrogenase/NADPH:quinone reductase-like Zn-dependent oxidoreductase
MKQVLQDLRSGRIEVVEVPRPVPAAGHLLVQTHASLISAGSERTLVEFGKASWLARARSQPERVRQVLDKLRTDGLMPTLEAVFARLDEPLPLGYCNAGRVVAAGPGVNGIHAGDRVASNGPHAEFVQVPMHLCARVPDQVADDHAAFTVLGAVALQGVRLLQPAIGESVGVIGLGLVGLLGVQILRASGCRVLGIDPDPARRDLARRFGCDTVEPSPPAGDPVEAAASFTAELGLDGVLVTASAPGSDIIRQAARMARKRGRLILVGVVGLNLDRREFYEKELTFQVSCSYGPGRYDPDYEERGIDYPAAYVRWTEQRNLQAVLNMMATGGIDPAPLVTRVLPHGEAPRAYEALLSGGELGIILRYPMGSPDERTVIGVHARPADPAPGGSEVAVIGAGRFARAVLIPAIRRTGARLGIIAARGGVSAAHAGRRFGFRTVASDSSAVFDDPAVGAVFIATRHGSHAQLACEALRAGKHVYVEKPLALTVEQADAVRDAWQESGRHLMVGFNRRFAHLVRDLRRRLEVSRGPKCVVVTVNAGTLPRDHWMHDAKEGGGRLLGEGVHWIDLCVALIARRVVRVVALPAVEVNAGGRAPESFTVTLSFEDGSIGTLHYLANGSRRFPKERIEVFCAGRVYQIDNFRSLRVFGGAASVGHRSWRQDKGHAVAVDAFLTAVRQGGPPPVAFDEIDHVTRVALAAVESLRTGAIVTLEPAGPGHCSIPPNLVRRPCAGSVE